VLTSKGSEAWIFAADNLKQVAIAKVGLPKDVNFGFTLFKLTGQAWKLSCKRREGDSNRSQNPKSLILSLVSQNSLN
jgi:hypothetical protein